MVTAGEERFLPAKCNRPHGSFNRVRVQFDPPVFQEHGETGPVAEDTLDRLNQANSRGVRERAYWRSRPGSLRDRLAGTRNRTKSRTKLPQHGTLLSPHLMIP